MSLLEKWTVEGRKEKHTSAHAHTHTHTHTLALIIAGKQQQQCSTNILFNDNNRKKKTPGERANQMIFFLLLYEKYIHKTEQYLQKTVAPCRADSSTFTMISSIKNISVGSLDSDRLKTELHNNTDEHSDAHISTSRPSHSQAHLHRRDKGDKKKKKKE